MAHITQTSAAGQAIIKKFEKLSLKPYICPAGYPTIGWGNTFYEDGTRVRMTDPAITPQRAETLFLKVLAGFEKAVDSVTVDSVNQQQFDALVSLTYNIGVDALKTSTLLRKVNKNPDDPAIRTEFHKWVNANGKKMNGLIIRRKMEADLYFS